MKTRFRCRAFGTNNLPSVRNNSPSDCFTIYAIESGWKTLYVGITGNPIQRKGQHAQLIRGNNGQFVVIRKCERGNAGRIEKQIIRAYQKRGECAYNDPLGIRSARLEQLEVARLLIPHAMSICRTLGTRDADR